MFKLLDIVHTKISKHESKKIDFASILYSVQGKGKGMSKDQATHFERLEKAHLKQQKKHAKSCDNISQMMEMLKMLTREKQSVEAPNP